MRSLIISLVFASASIILQAQDDSTGYVKSVFKSTRIMNGHSVERMPPGELDFRISHRFGTLNTGGYNFFGLDQSESNLSLEYGITNWLMAGIGRGSFEKTFNVFTKFSLFRQSDARRTPLSVSALTSVALKTVRSPVVQENYFDNRLAFTAQILAARKISDAFSIQLMPTWIHRNFPALNTDPNDIYALGAGGTIKLTNRISFNGEYYILFNSKDEFSSQIYNPLSFGFDIETRGHVFQLIFTNSVGMIEKSFIGETNGTWTDGDIHFGFNISRMFTLDRRAKRNARW